MSGSTHLDAVAGAVRETGAACGLAFDGDADRCLAVDAGGRPVNGDAIIAAIALARGVERVVVTSMTNLGFHRVMAQHGIAVEVTEVGDRYVLGRHARPRARRSAASSPGTWSTSPTTRPATASRRRSCCSPRSTAWGCR